MSSVYNPNASNISHPGDASILSSSAGTPIIVTTVANHGYGTNDVVEVQGHETNLAANGVWSIIVLSATTFSLTTSVGIALGGNTGTVHNYNLSPQATLPDDGDDPDAASVNVPMETSLDRSSYLSSRLGNYKVQSILNQAGDDGGSTFALWSSGTAVSANWTENTDFTVIAESQRVINGDVVEIYASTTVQLPSNDFYFFSLFYHIVDYGAAASFASATKLPYCGVGMSPSSNSVSYYPLNLRGKLSISGLTRGKVLYTFLGARVRVAGPVTYQFHGDRQCLISMLRAN